MGATIGLFSFPISPSHLGFALRLGSSPSTERWFDSCATTAQDEVTVVTWRCEVGHAEAVSGQQPAFSAGAFRHSLFVIRFSLPLHCHPDRGLQREWRDLLFHAGSGVTPLCFAT